MVPWSTLSATYGAFYYYNSPSSSCRSSRNIWERRIAIIATFGYIRNWDFEETLDIAEMLLRDKEPLIQKAVGWMLREVGNRVERRLEDFLQQHYRNMPRTMLRYAIEKLPEERRQQYLKGKV